MKKTLTRILIALSLLGFVTIAFAHEYILLASRFLVTKGETLELHLFVAEGFNIQIERPLQRESTQSFHLLSENGRVDLLSDSPDGQLPVLKRTVDFDGLGLFHMERNYARITLSHDHFSDYLKEDHIENVHLESSSIKKDQRERYTRYIKCLVQSKALPKDTLYKAIVNQNLEIVLLSNPYTLPIGSTLKVQILFMGKPLPGKMITARNRIGSLPATVQTSRTDSSGICSFKLDRGGDWIIHTTHMIPCPDPSDADWESFWASYSFGTKDAH